MYEHLQGYLEVTAISFINNPQLSSFFSPFREPANIRDESVGLMRLQIELRHAGVPNDGTIQKQDAHHAAMPIFLGDIRKGWRVLVVAFCTRCNRVIRLAISLGSKAPGSRTGRIAWILRVRWHRARCRYSKTDKKTCADYRDCQFPIKQN